MMSDDDPFSCFGSDDGEESESDDHEVVPCDDPKRERETIESFQRGNKGSASAAATTTTRDEESCGVFCFHPHTEQSLLVNVRNFMNKQQSQSHRTQNDNDGGQGQDNEAQTHAPFTNVLQAIDSYCENVHWMMHIGPEKKSIIQETLQAALESKMASIITARSNGTNGTNGTSTCSDYRFICVELGSYCGYGSICLASMMRSFQETFKDRDDMDMNNMNKIVHFHLFTVEINPEFAKVAREMIRLAELDDYITVLNNDLLMDGSTGHVGDLIKNALGKHINTCMGGEYPKDLDFALDFVMIDHDKDAYLPDLRCMEESGLIRTGTTVVADNVVFAQIDDYVGYMKDLEKRGIVRTVTRQSNVEYSPPPSSCTTNSTSTRKESINLQHFEDGIEITTYLVDP